MAESVSHWLPPLCKLARVLALFVITAAFTSLTMIQFGNSYNYAITSLPQSDNGSHKAQSPKSPWDSNSLAVKQPLALQKPLPNRTIEWCHTPLTLWPEPRPKVALASFPGSGNTWLRYLLQQATGKVHLFLFLLTYDDLNDLKALGKN